MDLSFAFIEGKNVFTSSVVADDGSVAVFWSDDNGVDPKCLHDVLSVIGHSLTGLTDRVNSQNERIAALEAQVEELMSTFGGEPQ